MPNEFEVQPEGLVRGGKLCDCAGDSVARGAAHLQSSAVPKDMFGAFDDAHAFHQTLTEIHDNHQEQLHGHRAALTGIGTRAGEAAVRFTATDDAEAENIGRSDDRIGQ